MRRRTRGRDSFTGAFSSLGIWDSSAAAGWEWHGGVSRTCWDSRCYASLREVTLLICNPHHSSKFLGHVLTALVHVFHDIGLYGTFFSFFLLTNLLASASELRSTG